MKRSNAKHVLAVDLGGTKLAMALVSREGKLSRRKSLTVDASSALAPLKQIVMSARELANGKQLKSAVQAVGIAVPGLVRRDGTVWAPNLRGWKRMPLAKCLQRELGVPVIVESDRNAAVLGETWRGAARGATDAIVLMLGTGIGAGILSSGRLVRGAHELSGCAGWMVVTEYDSDEVRRVGQLESLTAGPGIAFAASKELARGVSSLLGEIPPASINAYEVAEAARRGDALSIEVYLEAGRLLGCGVANLISLFDPEVVVIGGGLARASDLFLDALRKSLRQYAQPIAAKHVRVLVSKLGADANLLGVARLAWDTARDRRVQT
ncbi:MAG TPA: ROK family protein [Verrucomicrobiae bacterium]|nr:ROK family protein [Verrucomicrobiae bacterium]